MDVLYTYLGIRENIFNNFIIENIVHLGFKAFDCGFGTAAFVLDKHRVNDFKGKYDRLVGYATAEEKQLNFNNAKDVYVSSNEIFRQLPNKILAYWCKESFANVLGHTAPLGNSVELNPGIKTGNNDLFLRLWYEVAKKKTASKPTLQSLSTSKTVVLL